VAATKGGAQMVKFEFPTDFKTIEQRLWMATGLWTDPNNYLYYAPADGRFIGVLRNPDQTVEIREKLTPTGKRDAWLSSGMGLRDTLLRSDATYAPDLREWYKRAKSAGKTVWTAPYTSFTSKQLIITKARPVTNVKGELQGVLAADLSLNNLSDYLQKLAVSANGVAYIVARDGGLIATSSRKIPATEVFEKKLLQVNLNDAEESIAKLSYDKIRNLMDADIFTPKTDSFEMKGLGQTYVAALPMHDAYGLDWLLVVAIPRTDLMGDVERNVWLNIGIIALVGLFVLMFGIYVLNWITTDIRRINVAALRLSRWEKATPIKVDRKDELGDLARSFYIMEQGLMHDALSGLLNREAFRAKLSQRLAAKQAFNVLFLDLNLFKQVNDTYGHEAGDIVLRVTAQRLKETLGDHGDVGRLGGDEFVIAFAAQGADASLHLEQRSDLVAKINTLIREPIVISDTVTVGIGTSIGASSYPEDGLDAQTLLKAADERMYEQKKLRDAALGKTTPAR
jgi:diguanylate cyclase